MPHGSTSDDQSELAFLVERISTLENQVNCYGRQISPQLQFVHRRSQKATIAITSGTSQQSHSYILYVAQTIKNCNDDDVQAKVSIEVPVSIQLRLTSGNIV